jgi:hypothetical protein
MDVPGFKDLRPAYEDVPDPDIQRWLDRADPYFDVGRWGALYDDGLAYWVGASLLIEGTAENLPNVAVIRVMAISKRVGPEEVRYSDAVIQAVMKEPMLATEDGRRYLNLRDEVGMGAVATLGPVFCGPGPF